MSVLLLALTTGAIVVVPTIARLIKALIELMVKLIATAFTVMFVVLVLTAFVAHGKLV
jgi:hypothetical protein